MSKKSVPPELRLMKALDFLLKQKEDQPLSGKGEAINISQSELVAIAESIKARLNSLGGGPNVFGFTLIIAPLYNLGPSTVQYISSLDQPTLIRLLEKQLEKLKAGMAPRLQ